MIINYRDDEDLQNLVDWVQHDWVSYGLYELRHKKTCLRGFWPGQTKTGLYSHKRLLKA